MNSLINQFIGRYILESQERYNALGDLFATMVSEIAEHRAALKVRLIVQDLCLPMRLIVSHKDLAIIIS